MQKKKDILFLCQFFYPEYVSSATLPYDTAKALSQAGMSVGAMCGYPKEYCNEGSVPLKERVDGIDIHRIRYIQMARTGKLGRLINYFSFFAAVCLHFFELRKYKTILVYSNPPILPLVAVWAGKLFHSKIVFVAYDLYPEIAIRTGAVSQDSMIAWVMRKLNQQLYKRAERVVALSGEMKDFIVANRPISPERVAVVPNWYEDTGTQSKTERKSDNMYADRYVGKLVVSYFGNMGICQDMDTILDAARLLKEDENIQFMFAGHGNKMEQIKQAVQTEALVHVDVFDFLHGKAFQDALDISDCALVSLHPQVTGLCVPSKTYANMMAASPIVAIMGESDIVQDIREQHMGYAVKNGDGAGLAKCLRELAADRSQCRSMGGNARKVFLEKYTTEICTRQYVVLMQEITAKNG